MSDHDNKCEFMLAPPDMNRLGLCLCKERALKARLAEVKRLWFTDADPRETVYADEYARATDSALVHQETKNA